VKKLPRREGLLVLLYTSVNLIPPRERRAALAISCKGAGMVSSGPGLSRREMHASPTGQIVHGLPKLKFEELGDKEDGKASKPGVSNFVRSQLIIKGLYVQQK